MSAPAPSPYADAWDTDPPVIDWHALAGAARRTLARLAARLFVAPPPALIAYADRVEVAP